MDNLIETNMQDEINSCLFELNNNGNKSDRAIIRLGNIGRVGNKGVVLPLVYVLKNNESEMLRSMSALELGLIGDARAVPYLCEALDDKFYEVKRDAAEALGRIKDKKAKPPLKRFANNEIGHCKKVAQQSLRKITTKEIENSIKKTGPIFFLTGSMLIGANKIFADNPADLATFYKQIPIHYYKVCFDADKSKFAGIALPFGEKKNISALGVVWADAENDNKMFFGNLAIKRKNLSFGLQAKKTWYNEGEMPIEFASSIEFDSKSGGLVAVLNFDDLWKSELGGSVKYKNFIGYLRTSLKNLEPMFGISYSGKINLDLAYQPENKKYFARVSKKINIGSGTLLPELRFEFGDKEPACGIGLGFYY
ncbi:MAG TPA: HEAT repeat domain-containing protein [Bacillota bacterium]|nr:HEAT repeat domain-containing protein [Bacillota bacterium]